MTLLCERPVTALAAETMTAPMVTPEVLDLLERSTAIPRGLAFVHRAPLDSVAITLGVHPSVVEHACDCLDHAEQRAMLIRHFVLALERRRSRVPPAIVREPVEDPEQLIADAEHHALGVQFLLCAPFETAAITFRIHPAVVLRAREILAARGVLPEEE